MALDSLARGTLECSLVVRLTEEWLLTLHGRLLLNVCIYTCTCVHIRMGPGRTGVCVYVRGGQRLTRGIFHQSSLYTVRQGLSLSPELTSQLAPGICPSLPPEHWDSAGHHVRAACIWVLEIRM